jgi:Fe2+ or Zn2+ uptake regulation protein
MTKESISTANADLLKSYLESIQKSGGRVTPLVRGILTLLIHSGKAYPLQEFRKLLHNKLNYTASLSTIYRMIHRLVQMGCLNSMQRQDGEMVYFVCQNTSGHHHHFLCTQCHKIQDVDICLSETYQKFLTDNLNAQMTYHAIQFEGYCKDCRKLPDSSDDISQK